MPTSDATTTFLSEVLSCPVCLDLYKEPKILTCGHSLCGSCTQTMCKRARQRAALIPGQREASIQCPQCRQATSVDADLNTNYALADVVTRYAFLDSQSQYRHCTVCQEKRSHKGIFNMICRAFGRILMISKSYRHRQATMEKMHAIHEALEDDILQTQSGNAKIVDILHQIIHAMQANARERFDVVADRLERSTSTTGADFYNFVLADAELVRAQNKDLCNKVAEIQAIISAQLETSLNELKEEGQALSLPAKRVSLDSISLRAGKGDQNSPSTT